MAIEKELEILREKLSKFKTLERRTIGTLKWMGLECKGTSKNTLLNI